MLVLLWAYLLTIHLEPTWLFTTLVGMTLAGASRAAVRSRGSMLGIVTCDRLIAFQEDSTMKDEMKTALETAMDEFDHKRSAAAKHQEAMKTKETEFSRSAERLFKQVIRPAMEEVEYTLGHRNHDCKIVEQKQTVTTDMHQQAALLSLTIKPAPPTGGGYTMMASRTICFALVRPEGKIVVGTTSSLPVREVEGVRRSYEPSELTPEEVEKQLVAFVKEVFA